MKAGKCAMWFEAFAMPVVTRNNVEVKEDVKRAHGLLSLLFLLVFIAPSCGGNSSLKANKNGEVTTFNPKKYCPFIADANCIWKIDSALEKAYPKVVDRISNTLLTYKLQNGKTDSLKNDWKTEGQEVSYYAVNYMPEMKLLVIYIMYYEGGTYAWIDLATNKTTYTIGMPVVSPDQKKILCINSDLIAQYTASGIQVFNCDKDSLRKTYESFPKSWGPSSAKWLGNDTIKIEREEADNSLMKTKAISPITLTTTETWMKI